MTEVWKPGPRAVLGVLEEAGNTLAAILPQVLTSFCLLRANEDAVGRGQDAATQR